MLSKKQTFLYFTQDMHSQENEIQQLTLLHQGDAAAFGSVFTSYYRQLCFYAEGIVKNRQEAEDLAMNAYIKLYQQKPLFVSFSKLKSFLFSVVHNAAIDQLKARTRHQAAHEYLLRQESGRASDELLRIESEIIKAVYDEIQELPPQCRQVVRSIFVEGLSVREIADRMGLAYQTVLNQKNRGIQLLRIALLKKNLLTYTALWLTCIMLSE